jgi:hypothetical protein
MPIPQSDVRVGGIYSAGNNQERRVIKIENGRVYYETRSGKEPKSDWGIVGSPTKANPPTLATFAKACKLR